MILEIDQGMHNLFNYMNLQKEEVILYLGGRIDDDNLYPKKYAEYLNKQIKKLNPDKIVCHTHWYAKKYYEKGILDSSMKIDVIVAFFDHLNRGPRETINNDHYVDYLEWLTKITNANPDTIYATYYCAPRDRSPGHENVTLKQNVVESFAEGYDTKNIKYFYFDRRYQGDKLIMLDTDEEGQIVGMSEEEIQMYAKTTNATDGFAIINGFLDAGCQNLNIIGFSAFGAAEGDYYFTPYGCGDNGSTRFRGRTYFNIETTENQELESDILRCFSENQILNNIENYNKLLSCLQG